MRSRHSSAQTPATAPTDSDQKPVSIVPARPCTLWPPGPPPPCTRPPHLPLGPAPPCSSHAGHLHTPGPLHLSVSAALSVWNASLRNGHGFFLTSSVLSQRSPSQLGPLPPPPVKPSGLHTSYTPSLSPLIYFLPLYSPSPT